MDVKRGRVLGAVRELSEAITPSLLTEENKRLITRINVSPATQFILHELEQALSYFTHHNSSYTNTSEDDFQQLVDEVLNNKIKAILVFDNLSGLISDAEIFSLSVAFQYNLSIEAITLSGVNVTDEAVCMLCEALLYSRVNYLDLSNTPLGDEAGTTLAALAHINPYLRTVIVDDTLIADDVLDEIDVACQFNQSNYEGNGGTTDESLIDDIKLTNLKQRLRQAICALSKHTHFCVAFLFGCCPNGDLCLYSHALPVSGVDMATDELNKRNGGEKSVPSKGLSDKIADLFATGGNWEAKLPPRPHEGASWRNPDDEQVTSVHLNLQYRRRCKMEGVDKKKPISNTPSEINNESNLVQGVEETSKEQERASSEKRWLPLSLAFVLFASGIS